MTIISIISIIGSAALGMVIGGIGAAALGGFSAFGIVGILACAADIVDHALVARYNPTAARMPDSETIVTLGVLVGIMLTAWIGAWYMGASESLAALIGAASSGVALALIMVTLLVAQRIADHYRARTI
jgi:hypothetical protein